MPQAAITAAIGTAVPVCSIPTRAPVSAPPPNCSVPIRAEALPACRHCGAIASVVASGITAPMPAT